MGGSFSSSLKYIMDVGYLIMINLCHWFSAQLKIESSPLLSLDHYFKIVVGLYDGYVKYEEVEIHRSAIMQDFQNSEKKTWKKNMKKKPTGSHFGLFSVKFVGYHCVRNYILFHIHGPVILHFLS